MHMDEMYMIRAISISHVCRYRCMHLTLKSQRPSTAATKITLADKIGMTSPEINSYGFSNAVSVLDASLS